MAIISCGKININFLIPILGGLIRIIRNVAFEIFKGNKKKSSEEHEILDKIFFSFTNGFYTEFGMIFAFIPFIILKYQTKNTEGPSKQNQARKNRLNKIIRKYYDTYEKKNIKSKYALICFAAFLDFCQTFLFFPFQSECHYNLWEFDILYLSLLSYIILKTKLYRHQFLSILIIIILGLGLNVVTYFKSISDDKIINDKIYPSEIIVKSISDLFLCLWVVVNKYIMEKYFCSPYEICMLEGIIIVLVSVLCICIIIIINLINGNITTVDFTSLLGLDNPLLYLTFMIVSSFYNISIYVTSDKLSPYHVLLALIVHECYFYVHTKLDANIIILNIIGFLILIVILIIFLFFIEILEFNLFDISKDTKKNIGIRANRESNYIPGSSEIDENDNDNDEPVDTQSLTSLLSHNNTQNENENL